MKEPQQQSAVAALDRVGQRRCVVLLRPDAAVPSWLVRGLKDHGADSVLVEGPGSVMVELARALTHAVVIDRPRQTAQLDELLAAVETYYPQVVCWSHEAAGPDHRPRLYRLGDRKSVSEKNNGQKSPVTKQSSLDEPAVPPTDGSADKDRDSDAALLTQEELTMLLGPTRSRPASNVSGQD